MKCIAALTYQRRNIAKGLCKLCPTPLDRNSVSYCTKHLRMARARDTRKNAKGILWLYKDEISESSHGRQPETLASLAMNREKKTRALLAELGIPPENAAVGVNAAREAILKCLPNLRADALTQTLLFEKAMIPTRRSGQRALKELLSTGQIERIGKGVREDPYRYFVVATLTKKG